ncbi:MAG: CPBP family intramembrane metalloprotease [Anaerolineae bacterium]|nr:CPBP family intramembrane metalloprotease [Anaerolineae bacterium]
MEVSDKPTWRNWLKPRYELLIPILGTIIFLLMNGGDSPAGLPIIVLILLLAAAYVAWIVRTPEQLPLPQKSPLPVPRQDTLRVLLIVTAVVVVSAAIAVSTSLLFEDRSEGVSNLGLYLGSLVLIVISATAGLIAERTLPIDLIPVYRQRNLNRLGYVVVSVFFIAMVVMLVGGVLSSSIASGVASLFGEAPLTDEVMEPQHWFLLFLDMLIGAGLFEELLFRAGIMTLVWKVTNKWGWGLVVSSVLFGFYHITLSSLSGAFLEAPIYSVVSSTVMGLFLGTIYRKRGLSTVVLVHALINFVGIMMFS